MADAFGDRVAAAVRATGPLCAGIDPSPELLHDWGLTDDARGLRSFVATCVEAFAGEVGVIKPQAAFFERHGAAGMAELERLVADARNAGLVVIVDAKRGDIDTTAQAYADAWLGDASPLAADAVTAHPYLGLGALLPLVDLAAGNGRGVIVVVRSSNPEGRGLQQAVTAEGDSVEDSLLRGIAALNGSAGVPAGTVGASGRGHAAPLAVPIRPAQRRNSRSRPGRAGGRPRRRGGTLRRMRSRKRPAEQFPGAVAARPGPRHPAFPRPLARA
jgi:orotidine-5'-phosphate decarboxylase